MQAIPFAFISLFTLNALHAQIVVPGNLVPNPSFEYIKSEPKRWMLNKWTFEAVMNMWTSPNLGSPDVLIEGKMSKLKPTRPNVDLSGYRTRSGKVMIGIKTWGCGKGITHCKEYIQVKLSEPLIGGHTYDLVFWISVLQNGVKTNNLGFGLSEACLSDTSELQVQDILPVCHLREIVTPAKNQWVPLRCRFKASRSYQYLIIGNLFPDEETQVDTSSANIPYAYYFIDDVSLRKVSTIELLDSLDLSQHTFELDAVFFELDKAELLPASQIQLEQLADWLLRHPHYHLEIAGHTDSLADDDYNLDLSRRRAQAVADFLVKQGIQRTRLHVVAHGELYPKASNDTDEGRSRNRRVEFRIIE